MCPKGVLLQPLIMEVMCGPVKSYQVYFQVFEAEGGDIWHLMYLDTQTMIFFDVIRKLPSMLVISVYDQKETKIFLARADGSLVVANSKREAGESEVAFPPNVATRHY
ncbi:hypothetical protein CTI12_AA273880 [Artemisia annua]|uniref:Uncharacterized protein n=1 Tax=Artemisia annua TaxID=35608 RepID=A0A2U1NEJ4_ARTAN|nr:hypothetical protein CTI12_AA273880 [Artemisia annua]